MMKMSKMLEEDKLLKANSNYRMLSECGGPRWRSFSPGVGGAFLWNDEMSELESGHGLSLEMFPSVFRWLFSSA
jgi:hypothetical protein